MGQNRCLDTSAEQVALARELGLATVDQQEINAYLASLADASVDVVLLMDVLEHFQRQQLFDILDEVFRVLRPSGKCIAHVPNGTGLYAMRIRCGDLTHDLASTCRSAQQSFSTIGFHDAQCFEDRPVIHGPVSALRFFVWLLGTLPS